MPKDVFEVIDFHSHFIFPGWSLPEPPGSTQAQRDLWRTIHQRIGDERALLEAVEAGDLSARVVNMPAALLAGAVDRDGYARINDQLAELAARHKGRLLPLASVDAFAGEEAARELTRAVEELGFRGLFVDCASGDGFLDAPQARPVLEAAAALRVPVFVHPVNLQPLTAQLAPYGRLGTLLARGTANSASLVALIEKGVFEELPGLKVVVTALALGGILLTYGFGAAFAGRPDVRAVLRRHVHADTMGFDPVIIRGLADVLGVDNLLAGSDWPIVNDGLIRRKAEAALAAAGLGAADRARVGSLNALRLLGLPEARAEDHAASATAGA